MINQRSIRGRHLDLENLWELEPPSRNINDDTLDNDYISYGNFLRDVRDFTGALDFTANILANHEHASGVSVNPQVKGLAHFRDDTLDNDCISYGNFLRDVSDFTGALDFTANILANPEHASGVSVNPQVKGLVHQLRDLIRRNLLAPTSPSPGAASPAECLPGAAGEPSSGGASPPSRGGASPETGGRSPPPPVQATARRGTAICATTELLRPTSSQGVLPWSQWALLPVTVEYDPATTTTTTNNSQQPHGSGGTFLAEYNAQAVTTRSLHQHGHAGYCALIPRRLLLKSPTP